MTSQHESIEGLAAASLASASALTDEDIGEIDDCRGRNRNFCLNHRNRNFGDCNIFAGSVRLIIIKIMKPLSPMN